MSNYTTQSRQEEELPFVLPRYNDELEGPFHRKTYELLPDSMKELFKHIDRRQEKDILLLGIITVMSGCMPNVIGLYDRRWVHPNLYTFIEAPAGAGKGVLNWARLVGAAVHQKLIEETKLAREQYEQLRKEKARQKEPDGQILKEPPYKMLFIPVNNSSSSVVQTLNENDGAGILFSTEADTLTNSLSQDWGNFSDLLRAAFHHETTELQRRQNREYVSIERPRLSVLLTGTKGQLLKLIPDAENGLFSRFIYYSFPAVPHFRNVFERNGTDPGQAFRAMGQVVLEMYTYLKTRPEPIQVGLMYDDQLHFNEQFQDLTQQTFRDSGTPILGTIHRLGLISFRVSMILAVYRYFTQPDREESGYIEVTKKDYAIASTLAFNILYHATLLMAEMKEGSKQIMQQSRFMKLYAVLPEMFTRAEAYKIASGIGISNATLGRYLLQAPFERIGQGKYRKMLMEQTADQMSK